MKTQTSRNAIWVRSLLLLPLLAVLLYGFSTKKVMERDIISPSLFIENSKVLELSVDKSGSIFLNNTKMDLGTVKKLDFEKFGSYAINASPDAPKEIISELIQICTKNKKAGMVAVCSIADLIAENETNPYKDTRQIPQQKKATPEEISEYNRLVKHYNEMPNNERVVKQEDANKIMYILSKMSPEQRKNAEKINFDVPPPPPPTQAPSPVKGEVPQAPLTPVEVKGYPSPPAPPAPPAKTNGELPPLPPPVEVIGYPTPTPPPPPPPPTYEDLVEKGATFYYNGKLITPEEARRLVEVEKSVNIEIIDIDKKPIVRLTSKK